MTVQLKLISCVSEQTLQHHRTPYATEITEEVGQEYGRQQQERRSAAIQKGNDIEDVRSRVVDIESSVARLGEKVGTSQQRLEDMLSAILSAQGVAVAAAVEVTSLQPVLAVAADLSSLQPVEKSAASTQKPGFPGAPALEAEPSKAATTGTSSEGLQKFQSTEAPSVDDFLLGMLQFPNQLRGVSDDVQPSQAVVVSGRNGNAVDDGVLHGMAEAEAAYESPSKQSNPSDNNFAGQVRTTFLSQHRQFVLTPPGHKSRDSLIWI